MNETDKRFLELFRAYLAHYANSEWTRAGQLSHATALVDKHMEIYRLELEVRLAEAKAKQ